MVLKAFTEYTQAPLEVQYEPGGKEYRIPPITIEAAAFLHAQAADPDTALATAREHPGDWIPRLVLGDLWDELITDKVPAAFADRIYMVALTDFRGGREAAERMFAEGVDPLVLKALLEELTPQETPKASKPSPRTGAAPSTRSRARTSTTTTSRQK